MRIAILSDIHGNLEALEAVAIDLRAREVDRIVCLGDMIGYGPDPEGVVRLVRRLKCLAILGNHEAALQSTEARRWMNFQARENNVRTEQLLGEESLAYCRSLPRSVLLAEALFVHGFPPESVFIYLFRQTDRKIAEIFASSPLSLYFVGHTHDLQLVRQTEGEIVRMPLAEGTIRLPEGMGQIVNAGSVGQPRDGDLRAKYLVWDSVTRLLQVLFVPYDCRITAAKIRRLGFPDAYAERLCRS
jgi:predicted phosphodiesterase